MKSPRFLMGWMLFVWMLGGACLRAQLPELKRDPWKGVFAVHEQRDFQFLLETRGDGKIVPLGQRGTPIAQALQLPVEILIEETQPNGQVLLRKIQAPTLKSSQQPTARMERVVVQGQATGEVAFEAEVTAQSSKIRLTGKLLNRGLAKGEVRFGFRFRFPSAYRPGVLEERRDLKKQLERDDELRVVRDDGQKFRLSAAKPLQEPPNAVEGKNLRAVEVEIGAWNGLRFLATGSANSVIRITPDDSGTSALYRGFSIDWFPDPRVDPKNPPFFLIEVH